MPKLRWMPALLCAVVAAATAACEKQQPPRPPMPGYAGPHQPGYPPHGQPAGPGYPAPPGYPAAPGYPPPNAPAPGQPHAQPTHPGQPATPPAAPATPVYNDPINALDLNFLRRRSQEVIAELKAALPSNYRSMVEAIPLLADDEVGEVNAFAACINGKALMAISDGLLEIQAQMARARATDEVFGSNKFQEYLRFIAQHQRPKQPIVRPPAHFFDPAQDVDGRKVQRQHQLFDEEIAFVLGHELAHHYLQHTGCAGPQSAGLTPADIGRALSNAVPGFNQPNEIAADTQGVNNVLKAGHQRHGHKWTEGGALLTLDFFLSLKQMTPAEAILFGFELTHPHPAFRKPIVQTTANNWRASGGTAPTFPFPLPFPFSQ